MKDDGRYVSRSRRARAGKAARVREQVMRDWLGCDSALDLDDGVSQAGSLVDSLLKELGLSGGISEEALRSSWLKVAGQMIGTQTKPESLKNGVLSLNVLQPSMRFHLEQTKGPLLKRLQEELGAETVREVRFQLG